MAFDFPSSGLTVGQIVTGPNNIQYKWDGTKWVAATASGMIGGPGITISDTAPASPSLGNLWFDSVGLQTYIWYTDPNSSQWTPILSVTTALGNYLPLTGGTLSGPGNLTVSGTSNHTGLTTLSGGLEVNGVQAAGSPSPAYALGIDAPSGSSGAFIKLNSYASGGGMGFNTQTAGVVRWRMNLGDGTAESGSNAGSNFILQGYSDTGAAIGGTSLNINRASGQATFGSSLWATNIYSTNGLYAKDWVVTNDAAGNWRGYQIQTNGAVRWLMIANSTAESGGSAGSDFVIMNYSDSGAGTNAFAITRANGNCNCGFSLSVAGAITVNGGIHYNGTSGANAFSLGWASPWADVYVDGGYNSSMVLSNRNSGSQTGVYSHCGTSGPQCNSFYVGGVFVWNVSYSDRRLKSNIQTASKSALDAINRLNVCELDLKPPHDLSPSQHWNWSLIADEVKDIIPSAYVPGYYDQEHEVQIYDTLRELPLVSALVKAVQQLTEEVDTLKAQMAALNV